MFFIKNTEEEKSICNNSLTKTRENSKQFDYLNKVNEKPWGKEYLAYQSKYIGIWILHVNKDQETSLHCHFKKDTILIPISGSFKINLFDKFIILNLLESVYVPRETFHGIHSYVDNGILMEIEIYTDKIEYTDKNDLLRIKDIYNRDRNKYETSVVEREPTENEIIDFKNINKYKLNNLEILKVNNTEEIKNKYDINNLIICFTN
jgi:mannose-6-phosphate isomerase-like protein (cupin superfamily)